MKVAELSKKLSNPDDIPGALKQLSALSQASIARQVQDARLVLANCKDFCSAAAAAQAYAQLTTVLKFIHKANDEDGWLLPASETVLPSLITIYSLVLRTSDPDKKKMSPRPGTLNLAITMTVQKNKEALRALCGIFELCVDFCEVDWNETKKHLGTFAKAAAAVLFGSNFQIERDTLNDTDYAMDELARYSSFALSHILLTKPSLMGDASKILGKRIPTLLTCLFSSPEISIQRSIILIMRLLYDNADASDTVPPDLKRRIENGLSATHFGNGAGLELFKSFEVYSDDSETQGEQVISKMLEDNDIGSRCFDCQCTVQMKGKVNGRTKKGGTLKASVDWNKNSIVVHAKSQDPAYFPLYAISTMKWVGGHKEIRLAFRAQSGLKNTQLVIQFKPGNRGYLGRAIEQRIQRILSLTMENEASLQEVDGPEKDRKVSTVYNDQADESLDDDDQQCSGGDNSEDVPEIDAGQKLEQVGEQDEDMNPCQEDQVKEDVAGPELELNDSFPVPEEKQATIFSNIAADGVLVFDQAGSQKEAAMESQESEEMKENSCATSLGSDGTSGEKLRTPPSNRITEDAKATMPLRCQQSDHTKRCNRDKEIVEIPVSDTPSEKNVGVKMSQEAEDSERENEVVDPEKSLPASQARPDAADPTWNQSDASDKSHGTKDDDVVMQDVDPETIERPDGSKSKRKKSNNRSVACKQQITFRKKEAASSNGDSEDSTVASIHSTESEVSKSSFCEEDEGMRIKLLSVVREVMKVRQKKSLKLAREVKHGVQQIRAERAREDRELLVKFAGVVKKQAALQRRKIASYKTRKMQLVSDVRGRLVKLRTSLQDCLKKLRSLKATNNKEVGHAKHEMKRVREQLRQDMDACVKECLNRKNSRAKTDSLFQGLAKLLQDS